VGKKHNFFIAPSFLFFSAGLLAPGAAPAVERPAELAGAGGR
jgi:hypothetical protein